MSEKPKELNIKDMAIGQICYTVSGAICGSEDNYFIKQGTVFNEPYRAAYVKIRMLESGKIGVFKDTILEDDWEYINYALKIKHLIRTWDLMPIEWIEDDVMGRADTLEVWTGE